jgi:hypothetical protein
LFVAVAVVAVAGWAVPASGFYFDIWGTSADGSMNSSAGYSNGGSSPIVRLSKSYQQMTYLAFNGPSDGADGVPLGWPGDTGDGALLADWLVGKKAFAAALYFRNATDGTCDPYAAPGSYLNDPVTILGFRCANEGEFSDRDLAGPIAAGTFDNPGAGAGDMAGPGWRLGAPYVFWPATGKTGYSQNGDINTADPQAQYYRVSYMDSLHPGEDVKVGQPWFGTTGYGGFSTNSGLPGAGRWAFDWLVERSDAHLVNSSSITEADCTGTAGELEPRDLAGDLDYGGGWFAERIDRRIIQALATPSDMTGMFECKGLVLHSTASPTLLNTGIFMREAGDGENAPYLAILATIQGDVNNDGCVDVADLLWIVQYFGSVFPPYEPDPDMDLNCDGYIDVVDLLILVENFGLCAE